MITKDDLELTLSVCLDSEDGGQMFNALDEFLVALNDKYPDGISPSKRVTHRRKL